jgi:hypothetical protein
VHQQRERVINDNRDPQQNQESPIPRTIKHLRGQQQDQRRLPELRRNDEYRQQYEEKQRELEGMKEHASGSATVDPHC